MDPGGSLGHFEHHRDFDISKRAGHLNMKLKALCKDLCILC